MRISRACYCIFCALLSLAFVLGLLFLTPQAAQAQGAKGGPISFIKDIAPIFKENCFGCHDSKKRKGKLNMTTYEDLRKGGDKDDPVSPGKPADSLLIDVLIAKDGSRMPPKESGDPLPKEKIALIEQWIKEGAKLDNGLTAKADLLRELRLRWLPPKPPQAYKFPVVVTALSFTPDGKKLVVGGHHELTVWDVEAGKLEKRIATRAERAYAMLFLPDNNLVVAGGRPGEEGDVRVYNINGGTPKNENGVAHLDGVNDKAVFLKQLLDADDSVLCLALSSENKFLAAGGCDRMVRVWDLGSGFATAKEVQVIENHADWVFGVAFSPDQKLLLTASRDKTAKVWDLSTKESVLTFPDHQAPVYGVAIRPDGKVGISCGDDKQLRFWNSTGDPKQLGAAGGHTDAVLRLVAHPKQPVVASSSADKSVRLWNPDTRAAVKTLTGHSEHVFALAISTDASLLASGSYNGEVKIWKIADGSITKAFNASPGYESKTAPAPEKK